MLALVLADQIMATFGGDTIGDVRAAVRRRRKRSQGPRGVGRTAFGETLEALPENAAAEALPVPGTDA
jgi:hypothetical protein